MNFRDTLERLAWTVVAAAGGAIGTEEITAKNASTLAVVAVFAGLTAVVNFVTLLARSKVPALPDPGEGLPGLPVDPPA